MKLFCPTRVFCGVMLFAAMSASAWAETAEATAPMPSSGSILASIFRMLGALAVVFAVLFLGVWFLRNWQTVLQKRGVAPKLKVLEVKSLGARQAIYVVGYERQRFMISSSPAGVTLLTALPEAAESSEESQAAPPAFSDVLMKVMNKQ